jgi:O-6-methylguanine DNA methyltransferase
MKSVYYSSAGSAFGNVGIVWRQKNDTPTVVSIFLPSESESMDDLVRQSFPGVIRQSHGIIEGICTGIQDFLSGREAAFSEEILDMSLCGEFQRKVLRQCMLIPRGRVSTYGRLAARTGIPKGARAMGRILARNPYPLIIPCHRVIRADGDLCGFGGGLKMKKALLGMEGIVFNSKGRVLPKFFW